MAQLLYGCVAAGHFCRCGKAGVAAHALAQRVFWLSACCWCVMFTAFMVAITLTTVANVLITLALGPSADGLGLTCIFGAPLCTYAIRVPLSWRAWASRGYLPVRCSLQVMGMPAQSRACWSRCWCLCAGAIQWTLTQRSQAQGQELDLVPCVFIGAVYLLC